MGQKTITGKANKKSKRKKEKRAKDEEVNGQGRKRGKGSTPTPCGETYCDNTIWKQDSCLEKEITQGTIPDAHGLDRQQRTGLPVEESIRMTEDRDKWRKYLHGVDNPRMQDG